MHVFLSPHLDDAALSCGGTIHQLGMTQAKDVLILNIMAGDPPNPLPDTPHIRELHERWQAGESPLETRRQEDEAAAQVLCAQVKHMALPDCVYRTANGVALYPERDDIFGEVHPDDPAWTFLQAESLPSAYGDRVSRLYAPLAAGHHVDHQLVRDWALVLTGRYPQLDVWFYEDYPYAGDDSTTEQAINLLGRPLKMEVNLLTMTDFEAKVQAVARYQSQISTFWADIDAMKAHLYQYMVKAGKGEPAERYWRLAD